MQIKIKIGTPGEAKVDVLAVPLFAIDKKKKQLPSSLSALDKAAGGALSLVVKQGDFKGVAGEMQTIYPAIPGNAKRFLLLGMGAPDKLDAEGLRALTARAMKLGRAKHAKSVGIVAPAAKGISAPDACQFMSEGAVLGLYRFDEFLTDNGKKKKPVPNAALTIVYSRMKDASAARGRVKRGITLADSQNLARDLSNRPGNAMTPVLLANAAAKMSRQVGLRTKVMEVPELKRRKMGGILGVGQGSCNPPRLIVMDHNPGSKARTKAGGKKAKQPVICLIGKGITFDSGGISIKPSPAMGEMKHDMSGAATVIGAMRAIKMLNIPHRVVGIVAAAENMPSATAYRPGDILKMYSGKTVEILNTDAEGRLVLADALAYANETYEPVAMLDFATLTGACMIALGDWATGLLGSNQDLIDRVQEAGQRSDECAWPLPLFDAHRKAVRGHVSDLVNAAGREAGMSTAAAFLEAFVGKTPWVHMDIAGTGWTSRIGAYQGRGATGVGVRLLVELLSEWKPLKKS